MKVIIGCGIAGLVYCFYHQDHIILTDKVGGQFANSFPLGARYLHKNEWTERFLKDLNIPAEVKTIKVGYIKDKQFVIPDKLFREEYFKKSRGQKDLTGFEDAVMNNNQNSFEAYDIDFKLIVSKLYNLLKEKIKIVSIKKIFLDERIICYEEDKKEFLTYDNLISTIPLNIFLSISDFFIDSMTKTIPVTYVKIKQDTVSEFNFCYVLGEVYHRISYYGDYAVVELQGEYKEEDLLKIFKLNYLNSLVIKDAQVITTDVPEIPNVKFLGRYAQRNKSIKIEDVVKESLK